jgi:hypothetical protein
MKKMENANIHLEIAQLGELLLAAFKLAIERLGLLMHDSVGPDIASLGKTFSTLVTAIWPFAGMATFMCL